MDGNRPIPAGATNAARPPASPGADAVTKDAQVILNVSLHLRVEVHLCPLLERVHLVHEQLDRAGGLEFIRRLNRLKEASHCLVKVLVAVNDENNSAAVLKNTPRIKLRAVLGVEGVELAGEIAHLKLYKSILVDVLRLHLHRHGKEHSLLRRDLFEHHFSNGRLARLAKSHQNYLRQAAEHALAENVLRHVLI